MSTHDLGTAGSARRRAAGLAAALLLALSLPLAAGARERGPLSVRQAAPAIAGQSLRLHVVPIRPEPTPASAHGSGGASCRQGQPAGGGGTPVPTRGCGGMVLVTVQRHPPNADAHARRHPPVAATRPPC